jgi:CBS domain-containing protein
LALEQGTSMKTPIILVAVEDGAVLDAIERVVHGRYGTDYRLVHATRAEDALAACARLRKQDEPVALLLATQQLPAMGGTAFLLEARSLHPDAGRVLLTRYSDIEAAIVGVNEVALDRYLVGPWDAPEERLFPTLDELLADWQVRVLLPYTQVKAVMDTKVARIGHDASLRQAAEIVALSGVGDLMVVDERGAFVGVLSEGDILRNSLPDLDEILAAGGTLYDGYRLFVRKSRELSDKPIMPLVIAEPLVMHPEDHVAKAATVMIDRQIHRLPVVEHGRLVGTVSRANICQAVVGMP